MGAKVIDPVWVYLHGSNQKQKGVKIHVCPAKSFKKSVTLMV